ncbi:DHA1 family inner membrane transport protein [Rhizobium leguminosarum]|uniref:DHA1 family inner membrane transport protein n=1 Tax=Rhizobium leguminosarum TaxID=384 RepID=A0AAE2SV60_RHILE|nr:MULTISPECIES: MFS transporter [Rhizobium]MBB4289152.1 DHA1 family inner membrane transport protein [Rhizobium leguminosarum]MBB4294754.1 DHA1 family inner membrane transport protein [Rhizobium leguminosarum]MBB4306148.1 DHA1 family inner membrane transport protein [Rhizobium leguminosarum]MBB4418273.1 DHA1 family inner membrane transport protein [Rhizobium leguminosarum]MBB4433118.1 DHA1 family inner membrane transport protein [Rhizobium esperanzae]
MSQIAIHDSIDSQPDEELPSATTVALVQLALACGGFGIGTGEFAIMGLLPNVAETFSVTTPQAGYVISAYALGVVIGAPVIAVLAAKMARRTLLLTLMLVFAIGNISSALAPTFETFTLLRFVSGLPHGAYFGVAALVAASMVPVHRRARAVGRVMLGLAVATLLGTPLTTFFGQSLDWQVAFFSVGVLGLLTVALIWFYVPKDRVSEEAGFLRELGAFRRPQVWLTLGIAAVGYGGMFAMFSYIAATTTEVAMLPETAVPIMLVLFGVGMNAGNFIGSWLADKSLLGTIGGSLVYNIVVLTTFSLTAANPYMLGLCVFLVGCGFAAGPALQTRLMDVAADAQTLAAASNHSAFNIANAIGAWLGGLVIAWGYGFAATGYVGAALSFLGLFVFAASLRLERRDRSAQTV